MSPNSDPTPWWRGLYFLVIAYLILGFTWWAVLLYNKNRDAFQAKTELLRLRMEARGTYQNEELFQRTAAFLILKNKYRHQVTMIYGESAVFVLTLLVSVMLLNRGYQKEMRAARQRRNFLLSITHELKSPLASIKLVLETMLKRQLPPEQVQYIGKRALRETERLHRLVNDLLLSAKLETAYQPFLEPVNLSLLVPEIVESIREKYPEAGLQLSIQGEITVWQGDRDGLYSVLLNLLENAVKYSDGKPEIEVAVQESNQLVRIEVADQGIGIADREKPRIFDKFYRVGNEDTRKTKGTGLGLFIVRQVLLAHGGRIAVSDNQPKGSVFVIELPNKPGH